MGENAKRFKSPPFLDFWLKNNMIKRPDNLVWNSPEPLLFRQPTIPELPFNRWKIASRTFAIALEDREPNEAEVFRKEFKRIRDEAN